MFLLAAASFLKYAIDWSYVARRPSCPGAKPQTDSGVGSFDGVDASAGGIDAGACATAALCSTAPARASTEASGNMTKPATTTALAATVRSTLGREVMV